MTELFHILDTLQLTGVALLLPGFYLMRVIVIPLAYLDHFIFMEILGFDTSVVGIIFGGISDSALIITATIIGNVVFYLSLYWLFVKPLGIYIQSLYKKPTTI